MERERMAIPNGAGAAAVLAAGIGSFVFGGLATAADQSAAIKSMLAFYKPSGALSGESTVAVAVWLVAWIVLDLRWRKRDVAIGQTNIAAYVLLALGLLLTFPPFGDLF